MEGKKDLIVKVFGTDRYAISYTTIQEFLISESIKVVPSYQRPYSWEREQVLQLINDIQVTSELEKEWFIGPIFTSYRNHEDKVRDILDGQQRLTTIILILRSIFIAEHLIPEEKWNRPKFLLEYNQDEDEKQRIYDENLKKYLDQYKVLKHTIKKCLVVEEASSDLSEILIHSKFSTAEATRQALNDYVSEIEDITSYELCQGKQSLRFDDQNEFYPTLKNINSNIGIINDAIINMLLDERGEPKVDGLKHFISFCQSLLYKITFIEIPLNKASDVLDIFESINNRGKKLALSDLIRFRTIKKYNDDKVKEVIEEKWNEIFKYSNELSDKDKTNSNYFFKSLDVFLQRFINSIATESGGYTEDTDRLKAFISFYNQEGRSLEDAVDDILKVLKGWSYIFSGNFENSSQWSSNNNVSSVVTLLRKSLNFSEQSQISFIGFLRSRYQDDITRQLATPRELLQLIKSTLCISLYYNTPANTARNMYIQIAKSFENYSQNPLWYDNFNQSADSEFPMNKISTNVSLVQNLIFTKDTRRTDLILSYYQVITGGILPKSSDYQNKSQIDHIMPQKWFSNDGWRNQNSHEELLTAIENLPNSPYKTVLQELSQNEDFYSETRWANSFVQLIGNKVNMFGPTNLGKSNNYWLPHESNRGSELIKRGVKNFLIDELTKKSSRNSIVPEKPKAVTEYDVFDIATIIERSYLICKTLIENFDNPWIRVSN